MQIKYSIPKLRKNFKSTRMKQEGKQKKNCGQKASLGVKGLSQELVRSGWRCYLGIAEENLSLMMKKNNHNYQCSGVRKQWMYRQRWKRRSVWTECHYDMYWMKSKKRWSREIGSQLSWQLTDTLKYLYLKDYRISLLGNGQGMLYT